MKYEVGQQLKVIAEINGHEFPIGSIVRIVEKATDVGDPIYLCFGSEGGKWWLWEDEVTLYSLDIIKLKDDMLGVLTSFDDNKIDIVEAHSKLWDLISDKIS